MADFADNFTSRYKIKYQAHGKSHTIKVRYGRVATPPPSDLKLVMDNLLTTLAPQLVSDFAILAESYSVYDTTFYIPLAPSVAVTGTNGQGPNPALAPNNINFQGLTALAHRVSMYVYGFVFETLDNLPIGSANFRLTAAESAVVTQALEVLNDLTSLATGSDNEQIIAWQQYGNLNVNSYYQRKARQ